MRLRHRLLLTNVFYAVPALAGQANALFGFFDGRDIDYWQEGKRVEISASTRGVTPVGPSAAAPFSGATVLRAGDVRPFDWKNYQDPRSVEFWDDGGDWIPPRPFREAVSSPNTENIDAYLNWQGRKAEVLSRFQQALAARAQRTTSAEEVLIPWREFKIAYFYQTSCPHCRASQATIDRAKALGADVTFVQLDHATSAPLHTPSLPYDSDWAERFAVATTPTWIFSFRGKTARHSGALRLADLEAALKTLMSKETQP